MYRSTTRRAVHRVARIILAGNIALNDSWRSYGTRPGAIGSMIPPFTPAVKGLVISCVVVFAGQWALEISGGGGLNPSGAILQTFGLVPAGVWRHAHVWQLATYLFLHGSLGHVLFNMLALWMFGSSLESEWGASRFLRYYFLTGIGAGLVTAIATWRETTPTVGASGAIYGLLLAFAVLHPNRPIYLYFVFPVKAKWFALGVGLLALYSSWAYTGSGIANIAHLGGMLFGLAYLKRVWKVGEIYREIRWRLRRRRFREIRRPGNGDPRHPFH